MSDNQVSYTLSLRDMLSSGIDRANSSVNTLEGSLGRARGAISSFGAAVGVAFSIAAVVGFGKSIVEAGSKVEDARVGLTTLLKDAAAANDVIKNTMADATTTPFAFEGLLNANKALISAGESAGGARETVLNLSNAIAATGGGDDELQRMVINLQQIKNTGVATAMDIKQFAFAGINIYKLLGQETGKAADKNKEHAVTYEQLTEALKKAHEAGGAYYNGLENMAGNTSVRISNLGDAVFQLAVKMFNDLKPAIDTIISGLAGGISVLSSTWDWMVRNKDIIESVAIGLGVAAAAWGAYSLWVGAATIATNIYTAALWLVTAAMYANPIGIVIGLIAALAAGIAYAWKNFTTFRAVLIGVWETIKEFGRIVSDIFGGLWKVIHGTFTFDGDEIKSGMLQQVDAIYNAGQRLGGAFKSGFNGEMAASSADNSEGRERYENERDDRSLIPKSVKSKASGVSGTTAAKDPKTKAAGSKSVTINISIKDLIGTYNMNVTNVKEMASKIRDHVVNALTSAVNDSQIIANQ